MLHQDCPIRLKSYDIDRILAKKKAVQADKRLRKFYAEKVAPEIILSLLPIFATHFPSAENEALHVSLTYIVGSRLNRKTLGRLAWLLAGNENRLRNGQSVSEWTSQPLDEWVPFQILECQPRRTKSGKQGANFGICVLAGLACTERLTRFWSAKFCKFLATKVGFSKPWGRYPFKRIEEFVGLRLYGLVEKKLSYRYPGFDKVDVTPTFIANNRNLVRMRNRIDFQCPQDYTHPCSLCPIGYDQCICSTHPRTYVKVVCEQCNRTAWTDPRLLELNLCLGCYRKKLESH